MARPGKKIAAVRALDCRGLRCPLPVLEAEKALAKLRPPFTLVVTSDDPAARIDLAALAWKRGLALAAEPPVFRMSKLRTGRKRRDS